ncbi:MAG: carbohydrate kinase family protein, partial [Nocardioidaceae bacterium]|nr:carbohydrate kinase family protein [Nocardioidaceae bacterium]
MPARPDAPALDVLVVGDANPDLVLGGDVVPRFGQVEQLLDSADLVVGGSGAIVAHGLARLGARVRLAATVGADLFGDLLRARLSAAGVDVTDLEVSAAAGTGLTVVLAGHDDRAMLTYPGAVPHLTAQRAADAVDRAARDGARHLHVSSFFLLPELVAGLGGVLDRARGHGMSTSLDTNYDPAERWQGVADLLPVLDLLF